MYNIEDHKKAIVAHMDEVFMAEKNKADLWRSMGMNRKSVVPLASEKLQVRPGSWTPRSNK